jgi:hypothetical protein
MVDHSSDKRQAYSRIIILVLLTVMAIYLSIVPIEEIAFGRDLCLFKAITGRPCPGCGMTRAIASILRGDFQVSLHYNFRVIIVFPLLCYLFLKESLKLFNILRKANDNTEL